PARMASDAVLRASSRSMRSSEIWTIGFIKLELRTKGQVRKIKSKKKEQIAQRMEAVTKSF
ncbi:MAG TPA: hypothetical protein VFZ52_22980, partial [Chryseolinea sp.]